MEPRSFTRNSLSNILEFDIGKEDATHQNFWLALLHMSSVFCFVFVPLLLWSWKKDQSYKIDQHGPEVLNFQITMTLVLFAFVLVLMIFPAIWMMAAQLDREPGFVGDLFTAVQPLPVLLLAIFTTYQGVVSAFRALSDKPIHYALSIPFVK